MTDLCERERSTFLNLSVPESLRREIERDAANLGVSMSDVARMRMRSGSVPKISVQKEKTTR
jgi:hypothetical protein